MNVLYELNKKNFVKFLNRIHIKSIFYSLFRATLIFGISFMILFPLFNRITASFKNRADVYDPTVIFISKSPSFDNYKVIMDAVNYPITLLSTTGITILISVLQLVACTLVAYGLARFKFKGNKIIFFAVITTLVVPTQAILLPLYIKFRYFNVFELYKFSGNFSGIPLINTLWPFVLMSVTAVAFRNGLYIILLSQFFRNQPKVLEEAAYIDGCGTFKTFYRIMLPGAVPMLITVFLFSFVWQWNDFYYSSVLTPEIKVLSMQLLGIKFSSISASTGDLAYAVLNSPKLILLILPLIILYIFTQRFFTESIERSGIVG